MEPTWIHRTIGLMILVSAACAAAQDSAPAPRHVSPRQIINVPHGELNSIAYSPAGQLVVSGQWFDSQIRVYDPVTGHEVRGLDSQFIHVSCKVAFSPDGQLLVCALNSGKIPLIEFPSGQIHKTLVADGERLEGCRLAVFSPDGTQLLTSHSFDWDRRKSRVMLWDVASGRRIKSLFQQADQPVITARFSPDGQRILTTHRQWKSDGEHATSARIWNRADEQWIHTFADPGRFLNDAIYSPDGKTVLAACGENAVLWDAVTGAKRHTLAGHRDTIESLAFSPDGTRVLTGSVDRTVGVWEAATGKRVGTIPVSVGVVSHLAVSPDGQSAAIGLLRRKVVEIWNLVDAVHGLQGAPTRAFEQQAFAGTRNQALEYLRTHASIRVDEDGRMVAIGLPQNHIPAEIFACVAMFPEVQELSVAHADIDDLRLQYLQGLSHLKKLVLHNTDVSDEGLAIVGKLTNLESLDLSESQFVGWGFSQLKSLTKLTSLDLNRNWRLGDSALEPLGDLKRLERLDLTGNSFIRPEGFRHLERIKSLKSLDVAGTRLNDDGLTWIAKLPLQTLNLGLESKVKSIRNLAGSSVENLSGPGLKEDELVALGRLPQLQSYWIHWPAIRDSDLPRLTSLKQLTNLRVRVTGTVEGSKGSAALGELANLQTLSILGQPGGDWTILENLARCPNLKHLSLVRVPDEALARIPELRQLELLNLNQANIHQGLACIHRLPRLRSLFLNPHTLNDDDLAGLVWPKDLELLNLSGQANGYPLENSHYPMTDPRTLTEGSLKHLATLSTLRRLDLTSLPITDQGLAPLASLKGLEGLCLDATRITDAGLPHLEGMRKLKGLSFYGTSVGYLAAVRLQRDFIPACRIEDNWCNDGCCALEPLVKSPDGERRALPESP